MLYHLIVHVSRNINGFWAMCDLSEASVSYVLYDARVRAPPCARERGTLYNEIAQRYPAA